jgi:hypothetical protein
MEYTVKVDKDGTVRYYKPGTNIRHRLDGPAIVWNSGDEDWFMNDKLHREDGPAIMYDDGSEAWYKEGLLHREGGPAISNTDGTECWYVND